MNTFSFNNNGGTAHNPALLSNLKAGILFGLAGFALNWFKLELFFNIDFLFGSIITMFALMRFGLVAGVTAAGIAASCTWFHWHHPWSIIIFTAEALGTGLLCRKRGWDVVVSNLVFWLSGGLLLNYLFFHPIMGYPISSTLLIALKEAVNGIANTLVASALFIGYCYKKRQLGRLLSLRQLIYVTISLSVVIPAFLFLYGDIRRTLRIELNHYVETTFLTADAAQKGVSLWFQNHSGDVLGVAGQESLKQFLDTLDRSDDLEITVVDDRGMVASSSGTTLRPGDPFSLPKDGTTLAHSHGVLHWIPDRKPGVGDVRRWLSSFYLKEMPLETKAGWKVVAQVSLKPMLEELNMETSLSLAGIGLLLVLLIYFSAVISKKLATIVSNFELMTRQLPAQIAAGEIIALPEPSTIEMEGLADNVRVMIEAIRKSHDDLRNLNETLEKRVEERTAELAAQQHRLSDIISATNIGTWEWHVPTGETIFNERWADIMGYRLAELEPVSIQTWLDHRHPDDVTLFDGLLEQHFSGTLEDFSCEYRMQHKDGHWIWVSSRGKVMSWGADGKPLMMSGIHFDITDRKHTEATRDRLAAILENTTDLVSIAAPAGQLLYLNRAGRDMLGVSLDEDITNTVIAEFLPNPAVHLMLTEGIPTAVSLGMWTGESGLLSRHGQEFPISQVILAHKTSTGTVEFISTIVRDITEQKRIEEELCRAKEKAESATRAKSLFLANMSHEIRTPMNGVIGMAQLLERTDLSEVQRKHVDAIKLSGNNLLSLINDILDLSKIEAEKINLEFAEFSLHECINDVVLTQKALIHMKGLSLEVDLAGDLPRVVVGDQQRIKQVLLNLLGNAIKFTAQGGIAISAQVLEEHDATVLMRIAVQDTGIGISDEALDMIFKPFVQEDSSTTRRFGGTGLGLAISKKLVTLMGGQIGVESVETEGSSFWFTIVLMKQRPNDSKADIYRTAAINPTVFDSSGKNQFRILLAEDDPICEQVATSFVESFGYFVDVVTNGREALQALTENKYDLVLMDCMMPDMGGFEVTAVIRDPDSPVLNHSVPVIALTANAMDGERERCLAAGMDDFLTKPLHIDSLASVLARWLSTANKGNHISNHNYFDEADLLKRHMDNKALVKEIVTLFAAKAPEYISLIRENLIKGNASGVQLYAHTLKGAANTLGLDKISALAAELEELGCNDDISSCEQILGQLTEEYDSLLTMLVERGWVTNG